MTEKNYSQLNVSVDELALIFSLINQPELGKSVMQQAFGVLDPAIMDEKLITASHSLLARELAAITDKGTVELQEGIDLLLLPLIKFYDILQVTINAYQPSGPEIINIYLGNNDHFTALRIHLGVVYQLTNGRIQNLPDLVASWLELPEIADGEQSSNAQEIEIGMQTLAKLDEVERKEGIAQLTALGFDLSSAEALMNAVQKPKQRGSVILTKMNSDNYLERNLEEAGAGFLYIVAEGTGWLFAFNEAHDTTTAMVLPATRELVKQQIAADLNQ
jgi:hypothetical protein